MKIINNVPSYLVDILIRLKHHAKYDTIYSEKFLLKGTVDIKIKYDYATPYAIYCSVYLNTVLVIPKFNLHNRFEEFTLDVEWCDWVVEYNKQSVYEKVLGELRSVLDELDKKKAEEDKKEIQENIDKIGV